MSLACQGNRSQSRLPTTQVGQGFNFLCGANSYITHWSVLGLRTKPYHCICHKIHFRDAEVTHCICSVDAQLSSKLQVSSHIFPQLDCGPCLCLGYA